MKRGAEGQMWNKTAEFKNVRGMQYLKLYMGKYFTAYNKMNHKYILIIEFTALK
jgi:hypothetical protein